MKKLIGGVAFIASSAFFCYLLRENKSDESCEERILQEDIIEYREVETYDDEFDEDEVFICSRCENEFKECSEDSFIYDKYGNCYCEICAEINESLNSVNSNTIGDTDYDWGM
ncbi:hypothetical protein QJR60_11080 [Paraclostridium sordellii]|uniref:hypothetical protein n=1 Tax=Paraclostridium sordellii TaxID=1505 RepID=UPI0030D2F3D4